MMRRIIAGIAALLLGLGLGSALLAGVASAQPGDAAAKYGRAYVESVKKNLKDLCPTDPAADSDEGSSESEGDSSSGSGDSGMADPGLDKPAAGSCSGITDPKLWEAVKDCAKEKFKSEDELDSDAEKEFLECMAGKGFGEEPEKDEEKSDPETEESSAKLSLDAMSAALTAFYVDSLSPADAPTGDEEKADPAAKAEAATALKVWEPLLTYGATAGGFIGSPSACSSQGGNGSSCSGWIFGSGNAANDASLKISAFERAESTTLGNGYEARTASDRGVEEYLLYGATLSGLGLDGTAAKDESSVISRSFGGMVLMAAYAAASSIDTVFSATVSVLQWLNPFDFLADAIRPHTNPTFTEGMQGAEAPEASQGALDELREFVSDVIDGIMGWSWYVTLPMLLAWTVLMMVLSNKGGNGTRFKNLAVKIAFVAIGVPLLGTSYTGVLKSMEGASGEGAGAQATKVVLSTIVDFEAWADHRLASPGTTENQMISWDRELHAPTGTSAAQTRRATLSINAGSRDEWAFVAPKLSEDDTQWNAEMLGGATTPDANNGVAATAKAFTSTLGLLRKYMSGEQISAGSYETEVKAALTQVAQRTGEGDTVRGWVEDFTNPQALASMTAEDLKELKNPLIQVAPGGMSGHAADDGAIMSFAHGQHQECKAGDVVAEGWEAGKDPIRACNLSPLAMYNYLNTSFTGDSATLYSPSATTSAYAREQHMAANLVGGGIMGPVYWFSAVTLLVSFTLIGFYYCLALLFSTVRNGVTTLASVPFALLGFQAGIAKVVVTTAVMIIEIVGTLFLYQMVTQLLLVVPTILEGPLAEKTAHIDEGEAVGLAGAAAGAAVTAFENPVTALMIISVVSSIGVIGCTMVAIKVRSALLEGFRAAAERVSNAFFGTAVGTEPGPPGAMRQGVARGAGMALTGTALNMVRDGDGADAAGAGGDIAVDADGTAGDGGGNGNPGAPGAGDGATTVDKDGGLLDAAGNPVMGVDGQQLTAADMMPVDAQGQVTDGSGSPILGADGSPLEADDVAGFDGDGRLLGEDGNPLLDANGNELTSQPASALASQLAGDRTLASKVLGQGGLSSLENSLGPNQNPGVPVVSQSEPQAPAAPETTPSGVPRRVPGELHSDSVVSGAAGFAQQAAVMSATSAVTQRLVGGGRRGGGLIGSAVQQSMSGTRGGSKGGGGGGGGGTGAAGGPPRRRTPGVVSTGMTSAATAAMMNQSGQSEGTPGEGTARPPRS